MLAHRDQPDLAKAYELVINALRTSPTEARFRDTLATILMKQGRYYEAIAEFESILEKATDKISIHRKLAELYANVKEHSLAQKHAERANEMTKNAGEKKGK